MQRGISGLGVMLVLVAAGCVPAILPVASTPSPRQAEVAPAVAPPVAQAPVVPAVSQAQVAAAVAKYDSGRALMKAKQYAEACDAFAQSQKLDPGWGTLYNLAMCYEAEGKLLSARATFHKLAQPDTYPAPPGEMTPERESARREGARVRASALDSRVPRLRFTSDMSWYRDELVLTLDGVDVTSLLNTDIPVDPGQHAVHGSVGYADEDRVVIGVEGKTVTVELDYFFPPRPPPPLPPDTAPTPDPRPGAQPEPAPRLRTYGMIVAGGGGALVVTGLVFGALARSAWSTAENGCADHSNTSADKASAHICANADALNSGPVRDARARANVSTALVIGGAAVAGVGAVLWLIAPSQHQTSTALGITPGVGAGGVSLAVDGRF